MGDYALTEELFGVQASGSASKPVNREEHEALGTIIGKKLSQFVESYHFGTAMKTVLKEALAEAKSDQIKELVSTLNVLASARKKETRRVKRKKAFRRCVITITRTYTLASPRM